MSRTYVQNTKTVINKEKDNKTLCKCNVPAVERVSNKDNDNKGKKFLTCKNQKCKFFQWIDKPVDSNNNNNKRKVNDSETVNVIGSSENRIDTLYIYTDGCCIGNKNVAITNNPAGWGVVVAVQETNNNNNSNTNLTVTDELFGPVVLDKSSPYYIGAIVASNNTGELSAIGEALLWVRDYCISSSPVVIRYDSEYAAKSILGIYNGEKNRELIESIRRIFEEVKKKRKVQFEHVKGHSNNTWNDRADTLANQGASNEFCCKGRFSTMHYNNISSSNNNNINSNNQKKLDVIDLISDDDNSSPKKRKSNN